MIQIVPSISISEGKVVKLSSATTNNAHLYEKSPLDLAKYFEDHGIKRLHFVDLDGAREKSVINYDTLQVIAGHTGLNINFSGGIRTDGSVQLALDHGARTVTVATTAATHPDVFMSWLITFGRDKLVLGADTNDGKISINSWRNQTELNTFDHVQYFYDRGAQFLKCTDVLRDGVMEGPNFELYKQMVEKFPNMRVVASGGVRSVADIEKLQEIGVWAVIIARAFYEDHLNMKDLSKYLA
jgi:phosphoribosylformimino-5-aminoimidazole carboxamide ribotide isomerase